MTRLIMTTLLALALTGCAGKYQLVKFGLDANEPTGWTVFHNLRGPQSELESVVLQVAGTKHNTPCQNSMVYFIIEDSTAAYVDVVGNTASYDPFEERDVMRYRIIDGRIAAQTETSREVFPSADFERAVLEIATKAADPNVLMQYDKLDRPVTLSARPTSACKAVVNVFSGNGGGKGEVVAEKIVNGCFSVTQAMAVE